MVTSPPNRPPTNPTQPGPVGGAPPPTAALASPLALKLYSSRLLMCLFSIFISVFPPLESHHPSVSCVPSVNVCARYVYVLCCVVCVCVCVCVCVRAVVLCWVTFVNSSECIFSHSSCLCECPEVCILCGVRFGVTGAQCCNG